MKILNKIFVIFLLSIFFIPNVFSFGVFEKNDNFESGYEDIITYFTNEEIPKLNLNITAFNNKLLVEKGVLFYNNKTKTFEVNSEILAHKSNKYDFDLALANDFNLKLSENTRFKLTVKAGEKEVIPLGDKTDFYLKYKNSTLNLENFKYKNKFAKLLFDDSVAKITIYLNGKFVSFNNIDSDLKLKYEKENYIDVNLAPIIKSLDEDFNFTIKYTDLIGREYTENKIIYKPGEDFSMRLLRLSDGDNVSYDYNTNIDFKELFNSTIYTNAQNTKLKIETNKKASCYLLEASTNDDFNSVLNFETQALKKLNSFDNLLHEVEIPALSQTIYIACQNNYNKEEILYLHNFLKLNNLPTLEKYNLDKLKIQTSYPDSKINENPYKIKVTTNTPAVCFYDFKTNTKLKYVNDSFKTHRSDFVDKIGKYKIKYTCIDRVYNIDKVEHDLNVDVTSGLIADMISDDVTNKNAIDVVIKLGNPNMDCRYTTGSIVGYQNLFSTFTNTTKNSQDETLREFALTNLVQESKNKFNLLCRDLQNHIYVKEFSVLHTNGKIEIGNFSFINKGGRLNDKYTSSTTSLNFQLTAISDLKLKGLAVINGNNFKQNFTLDSINNDGEKTQFSLKPKLVDNNDKKINLTVAKSITITIENKFSNKKITKNILFDLIPPKLTQQKTNDGIILKCSDKVGCDKVYFGFAKTQATCMPNKIYENGTIKTGENNFFCAKAIDNVGLESATLYEKLREIATDVDIDKVIPVYEPDDNTDKVIEDEDDEDIDVKPVDFTPENPTEEENDDNGLIIGLSIALLLGAIGGGGYYAYKKGYLDKELARLGILKNNKNNKEELYKSIVTNNSNKPKTTSPINNLVKNNTNNNSNADSSYDKYIGKLNRFMNNKISKSTDKFKEFDKRSTGQVDGYNDTLISHKNNITKNNYDEFYQKSNKASKSSFEDINLDSNSDAESFEEFYKNKKTKKTDKNL